MKKANKRNGSKAIAILLSLLLCLTMIPQAAFAQENSGYTITFATEGVAFENTGIQWDDSWATQLEVGSQSVTKEDGEDYIVFGIVNYFNKVIEKNPIKEILINGDKYTPPTSNKSGATYKNDAYEIEFGVYPDSQEFPNSLDFYLTPLGTTTEFKITFVFEAKEEPLFSEPAVTAGDGGNIESITYKKNTDTASIYKVTTSPSEGYVLDYIEDERGNRTISDDGKSAEITVTKNDETFKAVFSATAVKLQLGSLIAPASDMASGNINPSSWDVSFSTKTISESQRVKVRIAAKLMRTVAGKDIQANLYAGENTEGELIGTSAVSDDDKRELQPGDINLNFIIRHMPKVDKVTAEIIIGDEKVTRTYDVEVMDSEDKALTFLESPSTGKFSPYPTDNRTSAPGPNVYDATAVVDESTGKLSMYFAVSGGIMKYTSGASGLVWSGGPWFSYNTTNPGYVFAIGGSTQEDLAALVCDNSDSETGIQCYLMSMENGTWKKIENSELRLTEESARSRYGLVLSAQDVWTADQHWNGSKWVNSDYSFNSFWKEDTDTAYAGSSDGIYCYNEGAWEKVDGTSDQMYITSGTKSNGQTTLITASAYSYWNRVDYNSYSSNASYKKVTINESDNLVEQVQIDTSGLKAVSGEDSVYVGIAANGTIYGIAVGGQYLGASTLDTDYRGSSVFRYDDSKWIYQNISEFDDPDESDNPSEKIRADGVRYILNPCSGISLYLGQTGAVYIDYCGTPTITFDSMGGSAVNPISQSIGTALSLIDEPVREGYIFAGWYTDAEYNHAFTTTTMPATDLVLYAKWVTAGGGTDELSEIRQAAISTLREVYGNYSQSDYSTTEWNKIQKAYNEGISNINSAKSYAEIQTALSAAGEAMAAANPSGVIKVCVSVEKFTLGQGYVIEPTIVTVPKNERASVVLTDLLRKNGRSWQNTGSINSGFYLAQVSDPNRGEITIPEAILNAIKAAEGKYTLTDVQDPSYLGEFDYYGDSGWMYSVNGSFPGVGASAWTLNNGDIMLSLIHI